MFPQSYQCLFSSCEKKKALSLPHSLRVLLRLRFMAVFLLLLLFFFKAIINASGCYVNWLRNVLWRRAWLHITDAILSGHLTLFADVIKSSDNIVTSFCFLSTLILEKGQTRGLKGQRVSWGCLRQHLICFYLSKLQKWSLNIILIFPTFSPNWIGVSMTGFYCNI